MFSGFAGQDHDLAHHVGAAEVESGIGFGISFGLCLAHHFGEGARTVVVVEDEVEGSTEHGLYSMDNISAASQVV